MAKPKRIPETVVDDITVRANPKEIKILGLVSPGIKENSKIHNLNPYVALKYYKNDWQCFSNWQNTELEQLSSFIALLQKYTWDQVYRTGGTIPKHGLAYTKYKLEDVKSESIKNALKSVQDEISEDINFFELRVNQEKLRVHGFQSQSIFFLVALDREHEAFPM